MKIKIPIERYPTAACNLETIAANIDNKKISDEDFRRFVTTICESYQEQEQTNIKVRNNSLTTCNDYGIRKRKKYFKRY